MHNEIFAVVVKIKVYTLRIKGGQPRKSIGGGLNFPFQEVSPFHPITSSQLEICKPLE